MQIELKNKIVRSLETLKSFEVHGGNPVDYKETLAEFRNVITANIYKEADLKTQEHLINALGEITSAISMIDSMRSGKDSDGLLKEGKFIERFASNLLNTNAMLILDIISK